MPLPKAAGVPNEYQQSAQQLERRRAIANLLIQQGLTPTESRMSGTGRNPVAVRTSPLEIVGKLAQSYVGNRINSDVDQRYGEIAKQMGAQKSAYLQQHPEYSGPQGALDAGVDPAVVAATSKPQADNQPNSVREFEFAKKNGYAGSYEEWIKAGGQTSRPSPVLEWDFYNSLPADQQARYLEMKRNPNMVVKDVGSVPTVIAPRVSGTTTTPLSTLATEATGASAIKQAEASGGALGKAEGEIAGGIQTKGANAQGTKGLLDLAEPLIDVATGSTGGAAIDTVSKFFGHATSGAEATAQLKVLQAGLMLNQPRMEGPQSNADVKLYEQAAAQIGDPTVPREIKKAALGTIRQIQQRYIERAATAPGAAPPINSPQQGPVQIKSDEEFARLPSGTEFIAPDGSHRRKP